MTSGSCRRNIPLFIAFRVLFNARWYYPIMAVLFLDFGLSVEQFALLNVGWAAAIVGLEVPSGALADRLGRKRMVVLAAALMVLEMLIFALVPLGKVTLLFPVFLLNRILSGAAEASASGADEALAYDSLVAEGEGEKWPRVLEKLMRWQSAAFFAAMLLGAAVYDAGFVQKMIDAAGLPWKVTHGITMRFPIYLTLGNAALALLVTLRMKEPPATLASAGETETAEIPPASPAVPTAPGQVQPVSTWRATLDTGRWILATPVALAVILAGLCFDSIVRLFLTFGSNYYRLIALPDASFGLIGSGFALLGFFVPALARRLADRNSRRTNFLVVAVLVFTGLLLLAQVWPIYGLICLLPLGVAMSLTQYFVSHYLNLAVTDSRRRATVLSFRGLAFNLAYGGVGLLFAALTRALEKTNGAHGKEAVFTASLGWLPWYFAVTVLLMVLFYRWKLTPASAQTEVEPE